jgi:2-polyprenyl-6-methoxyphenol hydroxylase-like FAD-dependent oxidoreductase
MIPGSIDCMADTRENNLPHIVVGSGPAGVACAHALLQGGARVVLLDAGVALEKSRSDLVAQMSAWSPKD